MADENPVNSEDIIEDPEDTEQTSDEPEPFRDALFAAYQELEMLKQQEREIAVRKAQIQQTINALYPLVFPFDDEDVRALSLPNAIRLVLRSCGRPINMHDIHSRLTDWGYDLTKFDDPMTNIRTAMNRLVESEEMVWVDEGKKKAMPGPDLKPVPQMTPPDSLPAKVEK